MHHAQITYGRQKYGHLEFGTKQTSSQIARGHGNGVSGPKHNRIESPTIFAKGPFPFRSAIDVVENNSRYSPAREFAEVVNVQRLRNV